jgi:UDP-glucose:(heptosyl)LPS alpha-1,3-glucosyltransferase
MVTRHLSRHYEVDGRADGQVIELADPQIKPARAAGAPSTAADRAWFRGRHGIDASDRVAVFAGHDFRRKGLRQAIEAVAKTQRWKLVVAGQGRTREYARWADALGIGARGKGERRVLFLGPRQDMDVVYAAADALILPTFYDSFGLVAIEALARGLPVISTEFMGAAYLVKDHRTGTIVSGPEETEQMAGALEALPLPGEPGHAELAARARTAGMVMLPEKYVETLLGIYQQVLREKRNVYRPSEANGPLDEATAPAACPAASPGPS